MVICPEASNAQNIIAAVSADGSTVWVLIRRLNSSCSRSIAFVVRVAAPLTWQQAREREKAIAGFLQAVRNRAMAQPPLANESLAAPLDLLRGLGVDHVSVVGADLVVQALRRMRKQVPMFVHRAALHRRVLPDGGIAFSRPAAPSTMRNC